MRTATRQNQARAPRVRSRFIPAPTDGWNTRDSLADMGPKFAVTLENWWPESNSVKLRKGYESYATGMTSAVESLMEWSGPASRKFFAAADNSIFEISSSGAVGAADVSSLSNNRWSHTMFGTPGGNFLVCCNGVDDVRNYDGTSWTTPTITGVSSGDLIHVTAHKQFLFFTETNSLSAWALAVNSISGAATELNIESLCELGGHLLCCATWSIDGGDGLDDAFIMITSEGEVFVWQGTDPANDYALVGRFRVGRPLGRRCYMKLGPDLVILTEDGFVPLSSSLFKDRSNTTNAISDNIREAVAQAVRDNKDEFGWQAILYPKGHMGIFNVPRTSANYDQFVANTQTGAWALFTGMNASCWGLFNGDIYFGTAGTVWKADTGQSDNGANITCDGKQAFNDFGSPGRLKKFNMVRPNLASNGTITAALEVNVDFEEKFPTATPTFTGGGGSPWDTTAWDSEPWALSETAQVTWQSVTGVGNTAALRVKIASNAPTVSWYGTDYLFEVGGFV